MSSMKISSKYDVIAVGKFPPVSATSKDIVMEAIQQ
jgi:hypothetical protein